PANQDHAPLGPECQTESRQAQDGWIVVQFASRQKALQVLFKPARGIRGEAVTESLLDGAVLHEVLEQLLIVDLPAEFAADSASDCATARARLTTYRDGQASGNARRGRGRRPVSLETVARRLGRRNVGVFSRTHSLASLCGGLSVACLKLGAVEEEHPNYQKEDGREQQDPHRSAARNRVVDDRVLRLESIALGGLEHHAPGIEAHAEPLQVSGHVAHDDLEKDRLSYHHHPR